MFHMSMVWPTYREGVHTVYYFTSKLYAFATAIEALTGRTLTLGRSNDDFSDRIEWIDDVIQCMLTPFSVNVLSIRDLA